VSDPNGSGGSLLYEGGSYGDVEFPSEAQDLSAIDQVLGIDPNVDSMSGNPLPAPASVSVSVLNGTGATNQAADTASAFTALGFHVAGVGDTPPVGDVTETYVYYGSRNAQDEAAAESIAHAMSGAVVMAYDPTKVVDGAQVTVATGSQFSVNPPAAPAPTSSGSGTTTTTAEATTTTTAPPSSGSSGSISPPNSANTKLAAWDPRACAPGAVPVAPSPNPT
jgi:hypothetical protein